MSEANSENISAGLNYRKERKFILTSNEDLTRFKLRKQGEDWDEEFDSIHQAITFARMLPNSRGQPFVIHSASGIELAHMTV
jgi:hypothetical protein